jgi:hypothetical protein
MHSHGGRLYGTTNIGHKLHFVFFFENGLKLSVARPRLRFVASFTKSKNSLSKSCHGSPSAGWLNSFSLGYRFTLCHCADSNASFVANILFSLGANGKRRNTFCGTFFLSQSFHLDRTQMGQPSSLAYCFLNYTQLLKHICIDSYPRPNSFRRFFASLYNLGIVLHSGMLQPKALLLQKKQNCSSYIMTSYEAALPQKRTLKIWNNQDKADA